MEADFLRSRKEELVEHEDDTRGTGQLSMKMVAL